MVASSLNIPTFTPFNGHEKAQLKRPFPFSVSQPLMSHEYRLKQTICTKIRRIAEKELRQNSFNKQTV